MASSYDMVLEFHQKMGVTINGEWPPSEAEAKLRFELIREELQEFVEALFAGDLVEVADALADLEYVVNGAAVAFGLHLPTLVEEVHASNMSKLLPDGTPLLREDGKVLKGPDFFKPNIPAAINRSSEVLKKMLGDING